MTILGALIGISLFIWGMVLLAPAVFAQVLAWLGFGAAGIIAGSWAAAIQGPAIAAGSWFAWAQAAGMTIATTASAVIGGITAIIAAIAAFIGL